MANKKKNVLIVNWGTQDKEYTFLAAKKRGLDIYLATSVNYPKWVRKYVSKSNLIITNTYDSERLIIDVTAFIKAKNIEFDGITTFFEMNITQTADLAAAFDLPFLSPGAARRSSGNKLLMRWFCLKNDIPTPRFAVFSNLNEGVSELKNFKSPVVIKPIKSGHSYGVVKVEGVSRNKFEKDFKLKYELARSQLDQNYDEWMNYWNYKDYFLIEEYIPGMIASVDGLLQNKREVFCSVTDFELSPEPLFLQECTYIPARIGKEKKLECVRVAKKILSTFGFDNCGFHCELKLTKNGPVLIEIAGRLPGGQMLGAYKEAFKIDLADMYLSLSLGKKLKKIQKNNNCYVLQESIPLKKEGVVEKINGYQKIVKLKGFKSFNKCNVGERIKTVRGIFNPALYYQITAKTKYQLEKKRKFIHRFYKVKITKEKPESQVVHCLLFFRNALFKISPDFIKNIAFNRGVIKLLGNFLNKANTVFSNNKR